MAPGKPGNEGKQIATVPRDQLKRWGKLDNGAPLLCPFRGFFYQALRHLASRDAFIWREPGLGEFRQIAVLEEGSQKVPMGRQDWRFLIDRLEEFRRRLFRRPQTEPQLQIPADHVRE